MVNPQDGDNYDYLVQGKIDESVEDEDKENVATRNGSEGLESEEESGESGEEEEWEWEETYTYTEWFPPDFWKVGSPELVF